jgi:hypothetical protein
LTAVKFHGVRNDVAVNLGPTEAVLQWLSAASHLSRCPLCQQIYFPVTDEFYFTALPGKYSVNAGDGSGTHELARAQRAAAGGDVSE